MEKRVVFQSKWLPYALLAPQIAVTVVFFFWPAAQAVYYSFLVQDAFGQSARSSSGSRTSRSSSTTRSYLESFKVTAVFSVLVAVSGLAISLLLATMADRVVRGALAYKTLLIWPYAVAPAIAGVLWAFLFAPSIGIVDLLAEEAWAWTGTGSSTATRRCCSW